MNCSEDLELPLRHGNEPAPAWAAGCAGPFLIIMCGLGLLGFVFAGVHSFQDGAAVAAMVVLGATDIWLTVDYFGERFRRRKVNVRDGSHVGFRLGRAYVVSLSFRRPFHV